MTCANRGSGVHHLLANICAAACLVAIWLTASVTRAADPGSNALPIHVVAAKTENALDQAEALSTALKRAVQHSKGWSLAASKHSLEFLVVKMQCKEPIDAACETRIADIIKADRYLWCVIDYSDKSEKIVKGTLNFFERGKGTTRAALSYAAVLDDANMDALIKIARDALQKVTGGPPKGGLRVQTGGVAGQLYVDGKPVGAIAATGTTIQLPSGEHTVMVRALGYADAKGTVSVKPVSTVDISLTMVEVAEDVATDTRMLAGFVSVGLGVAAGAVGLWAALKVNSIRADAGYDAYRAAVLTDQNACSVAREDTTNSKVVPGAPSSVQVAEFCDDADTGELIQAVSFPLAAVAAGVGLYLIGTSSLVGGGEADAAASALIIAPIITPDLQALHIQYKF